MERTKNGEFSWVDLIAAHSKDRAPSTEALFGWEHVDMPMGDGTIYRMFQSGGRTAAGMSRLMPEQAEQGWPSTWNTYIAADDMDALVVRAGELGGEVFMPPMDLPGGYGRVAGIKDPTGAYVFLEVSEPRRNDGVHAARKTLLE